MSEDVWSKGSLNWNERFQVSNSFTEECSYLAIDRQLDEKHYNNEYMFLKITEKKNQTFGLVKEFSCAVSKKKKEFSCEPSFMTWYSFGGSKVRHE